MSATDWITLVACGGQLALALVLFIRGARSPLAMTLGWLCVVLFGWNFCQFAHAKSGLMTWRYIDVSISPLTTPAVLHFVVVFVGARVRFRWLVIASYAVFGALSAVSASALFVEATRAFSGSPLWALVHLALVFPGIGAGLVLLLRHRRLHPDPLERARSGLMLAALALGSVISSSELWADLGLPVARLGSAGVLVVAVLLAVVSLRAGIFERRPSRVVTLYVAILGGGALVGYAILFQAFEANTAAIIAGSATVSVAFVAASLRLVVGMAAERARLERLALLGRMSDQLAHDLQNPIAAIKGAAEFLLEEGSQGRSIDEQHDFLRLIRDDADRLSRMVDRYRNLAKMPIVRRAADVNAIVTKVLDGARLSVPDGVRLSPELAEELPSLAADPDLLVTALENLVKNGIEAMPSGGTLTVRTDQTPRSVRLTVADSGSGMDARVREQALEDFYTTKPGGTGLGLPYARRVAEAHGGRLTIRSAEGRGTRITIRLPAGGPGEGEG